MRRPPPPYPFVTAIAGAVVGFDRCFIVSVGNGVEAAAATLARKAVLLLEKEQLPALLDADLPRFGVLVLSLLPLQFPTAAAAEAECRRINEAFRAWQQCVA